MVWAIKQGGQWTEIAGGFRAEIAIDGPNGPYVDSVRFPPNWPALATADERAKVGVFEIEEAESVPTDRRVIGSEIVGEETPQRVWITEEIPLAELKEAKWALAKIRRNQEVDKGCNVPGIGTFDTDPLSRSNINGAVTGALIANTARQPFSIGWKLADNSIVTLDGAQMVAVGVAVLNHLAAVHANAQTIGAAIVAAKDSAELEAIDINAGWP